MIRETSGQDRPIERARGRFPARIVAGVVGALGLVMLSAWLFSGWRSSAVAANAERLRIAPVTQGTLVRDASVNGRVVAAVSPTLFAPAASTVSLKVAAGETVKKGQVLVRIDDRDMVLQREVLVARLKAVENQIVASKAQTGQVDQETLGKYHSETNRLAAAEAEVASLTVQLKQAEDDYRRAKDLADQKWLSPQAMERARTTWQQVQENLRKAKAEVAAAKGTQSAAGAARKVPTAPTVPSRAAISSSADTPRGSQRSGARRISGASSMAMKPASTIGRIRLEAR